MRIALVHRDLHDVTRGGICTLYRALAPRLRDDGHDVCLITQDSPSPLHINGIQSIVLPRTEDLNTHRAAVDDTLLGLGPDIVESSSWEAETLQYARRAAHERAPIVIRGDLSAATMHAWPHLIASEAELLRRAQAVLAVSDFAATDLNVSYGIRRPPVVVNGIDRQQFHPGPVSAPSSGCQITLTSEAGTATSRSLARADRDPTPPWDQESNGKLRLVWVGKTTPMKGWDRLEQLVGALADLAHFTLLLGHAPALSRVTLTGLEDHVTILRDLSEDDLPSFYRAADFLISTSRWEGFGLAIGEALACGTPVLLPADLGTAPELLAAGGGHTYRTVDDLRTILTTAPRSPGILPAVFDWDRNAAATLTVYRALHSQPGRREV